MSSLLQLLSKFRATYYWIYVLIALIVLLFNLIGVFGPQYLIRDDMNGFYLVLEDIFPIVKVKRAFFAAYLYWGFWKLMIYSAELVRLIHVILFMIPVSMMLFYIYNSKFGLQKWAAFLAAVIPNILPHQDTIPAFINGSYVVTGFSFILLSFIAGLKYLETIKHHWGWLITSFILFFAGSQIIAENDVFLFFPILFFYLVFNSDFRKKLRISISIVVLVIGKIFSYFYFFKNVSGAANSFHSLSINEIFNRFILFFKWGIPFINLNALGIAIFIILLSTLLFHSIKVDKKHENGIVLNDTKALCHIGKNRTPFIYSFFILFTISTSAIFIISSRSFQVRYMYLSYFGLYGLIFSMLSIYLNKIRIKKQLHVLICIGICLCFGIYKVIYLNSIYNIENSKKNQIHNIIYNSISITTSNPQVLITGIDINTLGIWIRGSGYLRHITGRHDINGQIDIKPRILYNPFNIKARKWDDESILNGFDINKPLFIFNKQGESFLQMSYILQVNEAKSNEAVNWNLYSINKSNGKIDLFLSSSYGLSLEECLDQMKEEGISTKYIYGI